MCTVSELDETIDEVPALDETRGEASAILISSCLCAHLEKYSSKEMPFSLSAGESSLRGIHIVTGDEILQKIIKNENYRWIYGDGVVLSRMHTGSRKIQVQ